MLLTARGLAVVSSLALSSGALAQNAVQWRVEDGGNGHWYQAVRPGVGITWLDARTIARDLGGHLASLTTLNEDAFVWSIASDPRNWDGSPGPWLGGRQLPGASEPGGGWTWDSGEAFVWPSWQAGPYNGCGSLNANSLHYFSPEGLTPQQIWNDFPGEEICGPYSLPRAFIVEWSADCNNDGIVDYGQIRAGEFADANGNNVPDACESCGLDWAPRGDSLPVPTQADAWYGPGAQFLDANGDGIQDIVFASRPLQARLGLGGGHFGPVIISEPLGWFGGYCVADLNGDSFEDFVSYDYFAGRDRVMLSLGDGRFAQSQALVTGNYAAPCRVGDMDGDGDLDIVGGTEVEGYLRIFRNDGAGNFDGGLTIGGMGTYHREMELADLDGDGDLDVVVQNEWIYQSIRILRNDGNMSFVHETPLSYPGGALNLLPFDYDYDGDLDLIASTIQGDLRVYRKELGGFNYTMLHLASISNRALALDLNDFDGDGYMDLFVGDNNRFGFMRGRVKGGFEAPVWTLVPGKDRFALVELNGDGLLDVAMGKQTPKSLGTVDFLVQNCNAISVPFDYPTIQAAIDSVPAGAARLISVLPGTYTQPFSLNGKNVVIRGAADGTTILDGTGLPASIATFTGGEPATAGLENLVFRNGTEGSIIYKGALFKVGGAVYGRDSSAFIRNCRFEGNRSDYGGGAYLLYCNMTVEDCVFSSNTGISQGGGLMVFGTTGVVRNCSFTGNQCGIAGIGGGSAFKAAGTLNAGETVLFDGCTVTGNSSGVEGGAVEFYENVELNPGTLRIVNSTITGNRSGTGALNGAGGLMITGRMQSCIVDDGTVLCENLPRNVEGAFFIAGSPTICDCLADLNGDGVVSGGDLGLLLNAWGPTAPSGAGDVNHDGLVDGADLALMLNSWGFCP